MRKVGLILLALAAIHAPWRVMTLAAETLVSGAGPVHVDGGTDRYWDAVSLESRLVALNYSVAYVNGLEYDDSPAYGLTNMTDHTIAVDAGLSWNARLAVLAHEAGHSLQPGWASVNQGDVFAETVAMLVSHDGYREHARYLARFRAEAVFMMLVEWPAMYHAAAVLEDR